MANRRVALLGVLLSACATVSERPAPVEAPVSRGKQIAAQSAAQAPAGHRYKTKIAIARFTNESNYGRSLLTDQDLDRIGKQAGDMLMSRLVLSGKFLVLERPDAAKLEREQKLSGGSMIGADTVIAGSVTEFGRSVGGKSGFLSSTKLQTAKAKVDIRLVDVKTGLAYFSANGSGEASRVRRHAQRPRHRGRHLRRRRSTGRKAVRPSLAHRHPRGPRHAALHRRRRAPGPQARGHAGRAAGDGDRQEPAVGFRDHAARTADRDGAGPQRVRRQRDQRGFRLRADLGDARRRCARDPVRG